MFFFVVFFFKCAPVASRGDFLPSVMDHVPTSRQRETKENSPFPRHFRAFSCASGGYAAAIHPFGQARARDFNFPAKKYYRASQLSASGCLIRLKLAVKITVRYRPYFRRLCAISPYLSRRKRNARPAIS